MIFQSPNIVEKAIDEVIPYVNNPRNNQDAVDAIKYIRESKKTTYSKIRSLFNVTNY